MNSNELKIGEVYFNEKDILLDMEDAISLHYHSHHSINGDWLFNCGGKCLHIDYTNQIEKDLSKLKCILGIKAKWVFDRYKLIIENDK